MINELENSKSIPDAFFKIAKSYPDRVVYTQAVIGEGDQDGGSRSKYSRVFSEVESRVKNTARYLKAIGLSPGDKVAILSGSRPEWMEADIAILSVGSITVSIYQSLPSNDVGYILFDSGSSIVFVENQEQVDKILDLLKGPIAIAATEDRDETTAQIGIKKIVSFEQVNKHPLVEQFETIAAGDPGLDLDTFQSLKRTDLAALVYTSGTTGPPKGVMQSHGNHLANVRQAWQCSLVSEESKIMLFLPLAHSFARLMGYIGFLTTAQLCFAAISDRQSSKMNPESTTRDIREAGANIVPVVPRLLEKMQSGIQQMGSKGGIGGNLIRFVLWSAEKVYWGRRDGKKIPLVAQIGFEGLAGIRRKIRKKLFGDNLHYCVSGGAKLNPRTAYFFDMLGIEILEGYGLTETCVATNVNRLGNKKIGTVGPVLTDDIELKLGTDGEIAFRGPNITAGYYNRKTATEASWDSEGWFYTGDLGELDADGFLSIVGRKKEILVSSYGKNIAPEGIEARLKSSALISQVVLLGDGRPFCTALITLDYPAVKGWAKKYGIDKSGEELISDSKVRDHIWKEVELVNQNLANHEMVRKIEIIAEDFTVENGFLTPTFKVKKNLVQKQYESLIEGMYQE